VSEKSGMAESAEQTSFSVQIAADLKPVNIQTCLNSGKFAKPFLRQHRNIPLFLIQSQMCFRFLR